MNNIIKSWNGRVVRIREDRYVSLTDMAQACGKKLGHWNELKSSKSYLEALSSVIGIPATELVQINQGGTPDEQGTWGQLYSTHPNLNPVALAAGFWYIEASSHFNSTRLVSTPLHSAQLGSSLLNPSLPTAAIAH